MTDIIEALNKNRPMLSNGSIRTYIGSINRMSIGIDKPLLTTDDLMDNIDDIMDFLTAYQPNPRKTRIAALIAVLDDKHHEHSEKLKKILERLRVQMYKDADLIKKKDEKQELTERQKEAFIPWSEVMKRYNMLKIEAEPLFKLDKLTKHQYFTLQNYILLSLYVLIKPRRALDYTNFKLRNYDMDDESTDNYMVIPSSGRKKAYFVFNTYKNATRIGKQHVEIPRELKNLILKWSDKNKSEWLLTNQFGKQISQQRITGWLNNIFNKNISVSMLRHIYLTKELGDVDLQKIKDIAEEMGGNQVDRILAYVSKENAHDDDEDIEYDDD